MALTVLESYPTPRATTNPYIVMLHQELSRTEGLEVLTFTWRRALVGRYDVFHVHWPDILVGGSDRGRRFGRQLLLVVLLTRLTLQRVPLVRTVHNLAPHEGVGAWRAFLLGWVERRARHRIYIDPVSDLDSRGPGSRILHGHFRDWFAGASVADIVPGRLSYVGLIRPYKNVEGLVAAFRGLDERDRSLEIAGSPATSAQAASVCQAVEGDPRIILDLRFLTDEELVAAVTRSELVVLPYREMLNSGSALAALSIGRPVLVPRSEVNECLRTEIGEDWVHLYDGELDSESLRGVLHRLAATAPRRSPDLSAREWTTAGLAHREVFRRVLGQ